MKVYREAVGRCPVPGLWTLDLEAKTVTAARPDLSERAARPNGRDAAVPKKGSRPERRCQDLAWPQPQVSRLVRAIGLAGAQVHGGPVLRRPIRGCQGENHLDVSLDRDCSGALDR